MAAHKHAEFIKAWADGLEVQVLTASDWRSLPSNGAPSWYETNRYRIKPAEPERVYPETEMTWEQMVDICTPYEVHYWPIAGANAALRHAVDNGQIVTRAEFDKLAAENKELKEQLVVERSKRMYLYDEVKLSSGNR